MAKKVSAKYIWYLIIIVVVLIILTILQIGLINIPLALKITIQIIYFFIVSHTRLVFRFNKRTN
jgi:hypothetical protein